MKPWFRLYVGVLDDPKVQRLCPEDFKLWINALALAGQTDRGGLLPPLPDMAFRLRLDEGAMAEVVGRLEAAGLLDRTSDGGLEIHNWRGRQFESDDVTKRVNLHRQKKRAKGETLHETLQGNVTATLHETPPDTDTDPETDPETEEIQIQTQTIDAAASDAPAARSTRTRPDGPARKETTKAPPKVRGVEAFSLTDDLRAWAERECPGVDVERETERFIDWHRANGKPTKDYAASWRNWMRKANDTPPPQSPPPRRYGRPSVEDAVAEAKRLFREEAQGRKPDADGVIETTFVPLRGGAR